MAEKASLAKLHTLQRNLETAKKRMMKIREVADDKVQHLVSASETAGAAFALGVIGGKYGTDADIGGIPIALSTALLLHAAGLFGIGGDMASHLHAFGNGALAAAAADFGGQVGRGTKNGLSITQALKAAAQPGGGSLTASTVSGQRLSDAELAALAKG